MKNQLTKLPVATEYQECVWFAEYLDILVRQGKVQMYSHIPNETFTKSWGAKIKNKMQGVHKGVPDYLILLKDKILFIEMKRITGGVVSSEQIAWMKALAGLGFEAHVAYGFDEAKKILDSL